MSLNGIKRRILSIENTSKITNAMKLIASSKLMKQTKKFNSIKDYYSEYYLVVSALLSFIDEKDFPTSDNGKTLWIVVTSNLGLCGGYNVNLYKEIDKSINSDDTLLIFGKKGIEHYEKNFSNNKFIDGNLIDIDGEITAQKCAIIAHKIFKAFNSGEFSKIKIAYTKFVNAIIFKPVVMDVFPFDEKIKTLNQVNLKENSFDFEPSKKELIFSIIPQYLSMVIYASLIESILSESSSRRNAMDTATTNAEELIGKYRLQYNHLRQAKITNEIIEIIAGNEEG